jgi:hypothetical protein
MTKLQKYLFFLTIIIFGLIFTASYTGDLEMGWLGMFIIAPIFGLIIGFCSFLLFRLFKVKIKMPILLLGLYFSFVFCTALLFEELFFGLIRHQYNKYAKLKNEAEEEKDVHEADLGSGKILYFHSEDQSIHGRNEEDVFNLNFEYQGRNQITRSQIIELAKDFCIQKGLKIKKIGPLRLNEPLYTKNGLIIEKLGDVTIRVEIQDGPVINRYGTRLPSVFLHLKYLGGELKFIALGKHNELIQDVSIKK